MFNLVLKDLVIQKKYILLSVMYPLIFSATMFNGTDGSSSTGFVVIPIMIAYILLIGACGHDDKNKADMLLNSLPINRIDLVIAKYLSTFVFIFIGLGITFMVTAALNFLGVIHLNTLMSLEGVVGASISIIILSSLFFPINFKFGYQKARYVNTMLFMAMFIVPVSLAKFIKKGIGAPPSFIIYLNSQPDWIVGSFMLIIALIIMVVSLLISARIYVNKDL